ncbi:MAG TPA: hypothetical protein PKZ32_05180, partial [Candidatus Melainabacteria bacterium]|nr:hypothetical protein [Candidatus Melainabacteria bacterium]
MTTNNLANDSSFIEHKQHSVVHDGFVNELLHSAAYSFVQSPVEGAAQLFDHTAGKAIHSNLYKNCKDAIVSAPKQAAFASPEWHGQALGSAIGILPWFAATKGALKSIAAKSPLSTSILAADEAALNSSFFSRNTANLALEGGVSGAAFAGVFKPVDYKGSESNFWSAKAASMATDFATFATLNASSLAISKSITSAAAPLMERSNLAAKTIPYVSMFAAGAGSGIPAAAVEMTTGAVLSNGNTNFGSRDFLQNAYSYAFIGGALSGLQMRSIKDHSIDTTNYRTNKTAEEKTANPQEQNANPMEQAESAAPTKTHYTAEEPQQTTFGVYETKGIKEYFKSIGFSKDGKTIDTMHLHEMVPVANVHMKLADMSPVFIIEEGTLHNIDFNRNGSVKPKQFWDYHFAIPTAEVSKVFDKLPNSTEFKEAVRGKIVGTLPEAFKTAGIDQESGLKALNSLARALRNLDGALPPQKKIGLGAIQIDLPEFEIKAGEGKIKVTKAGIGEVAHVYKLKVGDESFAFKVPSDAMRQDVHGVAAETAAFAFLNKHKISDLVEFYAANPNAEGWMLTEFVEKPKQREGTPLKEILDRYGLTLGDDWSANRGPGNVVWDIGGIEPKEVNSPSTLPELEKLLNTPEGKMIAGRKLGNFTDQSTLKEALLMVLNWDKNAGQVPRTAVRLLKNSDDISEVLSRSLRSSGSAGRAAFELDRLSETPLISKLFYEAITKKESRLEAAKMIDRLPKSDRFEAFKQAIIYPEARAMAARSIESLPSNNRKAAIEMLQSDPGARYVMLETRLMKGNHFEDKQNALEQYFDQYGLKTGKRTNVQEKTPDFKAMYPDDEIAQIIVAEIWPQLTLEQKKMTPSSLKKLQSSWALLEPEQWKTLNESEISEFISACKNFEFEGDAIYDHPDLRKYLASIDTPSDHSIEAWMSLPRKFKQLPPADLSDIIDLWPHTDLNNLSHMPMHDVVKMARILKSVENTSIKSQIIEDANLRDAILRHPEEFSALPKDRLLVLVGLWHQISEKDKSRSLKELAEISLVRKYDQLIKELGIKESAMIYFSKFNSAESFFNALLQIQQRNQMLSGGLPNKIIADKVNALARQKLKNEDLNPYKIEIEAQVE